MRCPRQDLGERGFSEEADPRAQSRVVPTADQLEDYLDLSRENIERLVLYLLVQDALKVRMGTLPDAVQTHVIHQSIPSESSGNDLLS